MKCEWEIVKIGDLCNIKHGYAFKSIHFSEEVTNRILLTPGNFNIGGGFKNTKLKYYSNEVELPIGYILKKNDIIVTMTDLSKKMDTIGYSALIPYDDTKLFLHNQRIGLVQINSTKAHRMFIYWLLRNPNYQNHIASTSTGSTVHHTSPTLICNYKFRLPPLPTQKAIAATLSCLDDKIELNNCINKNLEEQAQALFKQWFVDFEFPNEEGKPYKSSGGKMVESELGLIPDGWRVASLVSLVTTVDNRGKTPPLSNEPTEFPIIDVKALSGDSRCIDYLNCSKYVDGETYENWFRNGHPQENDILISTVGSLAEMKIFLGTKGCIAQNVVAFRANQLNPYYLYQCLKSIKNDLVTYNIGSVQPSIKVTHIIKHNIIIPKNCYVKCFSSISEVITKIIYSKEQQSRTLSTIRDALLPKLMSGEIEVPTE